MGVARRAATRTARGRNAAARAALGGVAMSPLRRVAVATLLAGALSAPGCTLAKPAVCAFSTPLRMLAAIDVGPCGGCDGRALAYAFAAIVTAGAAAGAAGGLVTGAMSDYYYLTGKAQDPSRNLHDAFATNHRSARSRW